MRVDFYLVVFLKFIVSIMLTIKVAWTMPFWVGSLPSSSPLPVLPHCQPLSLLPVYFLMMLVLRAPLSLWICCNLEYVSVSFMFFWQSSENVCMNLATGALLTGFWDEGLSSQTLRISTISTPIQVLIADLYPTATIISTPSTLDPSMSEIYCLNSHLHPLWKLENRRNWYTNHPSLSLNDTICSLRTIGKSTSKWQ